MKFKDFPYKRPDVEAVCASLDAIINKIKEAQSADEVEQLMHDYDNVNKEFDTAFNIAYVRHSIDTRDEFYDAETEYLNENAPLVGAKKTDYAKALLASPYRFELEERIGKHYFDMLECSIATDERAIPFMQRINKLSTQYDKLLANAEIEFEGKTYTLTQMSPLLQDTDRNRRKAAYEAQWKWFEDHAQEIDTIYDDLVHERHNMALALGYDNFIDLQYKLLNRTDYGKEEIKTYREKLNKAITPIAVELRKKQAQNLGLDELKYYDRALDFKDGSANPMGEEDFIVKNAQKMYRELSKETGEFFDFMIENELTDLTAKPGKEGGGYCTSFDAYKAPFIFSNFNGTRHDVEVITHEAGHAFQNYSAQCMPFTDYIWPTLESAEIHSMSMEFLTWPWMDLFFGGAVNKFKYAHLASSISFLPYGATIDEFQHFVYENPDATPEERKAKYHEIELKYQPDLNYDNEFLNKGTFWYKQGHVFNVPFYYIDYTLAQVCAFQFLLKSLEDREQTVTDYIELCKAGGSQSFFKLTEIGKIKNPMTTDVLTEIAPKLLDIIDSIEL